jgi:transposase
MEKYIGLDVHTRSTTYAVLNQAGKKLKTAVVETTAKELVEALMGIEGEKHVCFEEGNQSEWLYELLRPHAQEVVCIQPMKKEGIKSDEHDALGLAEQLRRGTLKRIIYKETGSVGALRQRVRAHRLITQDVIRAKNRLRSVYRSRGVLCETEELYRPGKREMWLGQLPPTSREVAQMLTEQLDAVEKLKEKATERMLEEARHHSVVDRLSTVPGIGEIRAAYLVATVVTPHRFRSKRQFWAYCGFAVVTQSSADWLRNKGQWVRARSMRTRGLNLNRNPVMKDIFKGAALSIIAMPDSHPLKQDYVQMLERGMKPNMARLTLARKLAATVLSIWKNQEVYDVKKRYLPKRTAA